jgi:hypothetical protein
MPVRNRAFATSGRRPAGMPLRGASKVGLDVVSTVLSIFLAAALGSACSLAGEERRNPANGGPDSGSDPNNSSHGNGGGSGGENGDKPTNGESDGRNGNGNAGDPTNGGCISQRVPAPSDASCACKWDDCNATAMTCTCGLSCYGAGCIISVDKNGSASSSNSTIGACNLSCTPEDDLSTEITCSAADCKIQPNNNVNISPTAPMSPPQTASLEGERKITPVDVLFMIDNSNSMKDNQMAASCALESFFSSAGKNGAKYDTGVATTDLLCDKASKCTPVYSGGGEYINPASLVSLSGTCTSALSCRANAQCEDFDANAKICDFSGDGKMVSTGDAASKELLGKLIVQGGQGSPEEGGLEKAFLLFAEQERKGTFDKNTRREIVVISDENADADGFLCPFKSVKRNTSGIPGFNPPTPKNTEDSCAQDLIDFYSYYFKTRNVVVHGLLFTSDCTTGNGEEAGAIYSAVIKATGGHEESICACDKFGGFFDKVGDSTSTLSTELCFPGALPDPSTIKVVYVNPSGGEEAVPQSAQDGWTLDAKLNCVIMNGSWKDRFGKFRMDYVDPNAKPPPPAAPVACLAPGIDPIVSTIEVSCDGKDVPQSSTDGYTFDPVTDCFTFHGSWSTVNGKSCSVKYL